MTFWKPLKSNVLSCDDRSFVLKCFPVRIFLIYCPKVIPQFDQLSQYNSALTRHFFFWINCYFSSELSRTHTWYTAVPDWSLHYQTNFLKSYLNMSLKVIGFLFNNDGKTVIIPNFITIRINLLRVTYYLGWVMLYFYPDWTLTDIIKTILWMAPSWSQ